MMKVENPDPLTVTIFEGSVEPIRGRGDTDYSCPQCGKPLLLRMRVRQFHGIVLKCPHCGTCSRAA